MFGLDTFYFLIGGLLSGLLAGLLGIGGGLIVVPFLIFYFNWKNINDDISMHVAVASSLAIVMFTSFVAMLSHHKRGAIYWQTVRHMVLGCLVGALIGASFADYLSGSFLKILFGLFVLGMAYQIAFQKIAADHRHLPVQPALSFYAAGISGFCTLLGMGGGSLLVPFFSFFGVPMKNSVATSSACGFFIATSGVIGLIVLGSHETSSLAFSSGYVYWPAVIGMTMTSILSAPFGASLAHRLPTHLLRRFFAIFLLFVAIDMLSSSIKHLFLS